MSRGLGDVYKRQGYYDRQDGTYGSVIRISDTCIIAGSIIVSVYHYSDQEEYKK